MRGHNYGGIICKKCGKFHINPNKGKHIWENKIHPNKGKPMSKISKIRISKANTGKVRSIEIKEKMREVMLGKNKGCQNGLWVGDKVCYSALHNWIRRNKPKVKLCENCNKNLSYDLANISGKYKRDINDFRWLCRKCHMLEDGRLLNFTKTGLVNLEKFNSVKRKPKRSLKL
jgi:hypothetical protein